MRPSLLPLSRALPRLAVRRPWTVLAIACGIVLAAGPGLLRLQIATDGRELLPTQDPSVLYDRALREDLGLRDPVAVVVWSTHPEGIFEPEALRVVCELTERLGTLDGVGPEGVTSLATEPGLRTEPGTLRHKALLDPLPRAPHELERLRRDLHRLSIYRGVLVSDDGHGAAVLVEPPPAADRRETVAAIDRQIAEARQAGLRPELRPRHLRLDVVGAPVAEALLGDHLLADLGVPEPWLVSMGTGREGPRASDPDPSWKIPLVPAALVFMTGVFLLAFRRPVAALLPLAEVAVCLAVVFGVLGWLGIPIYLTTAVLPIVLTAVGTADEIHVFRRLRETVERDPRRPWPAAVIETMERIAGPLTLTSVTTAVAFLSFTLSPIGPVRVFGGAAAAGVLVCLLFSLGALPALLVLLPPSALVPRRARSSGRIANRPWNRVWDRLAHGALEHRRAVLVIAVVLLLVTAVLGLPRVQVQDSWAGGFASHSPLARAIHRFEAGFLGSHLLRVVVEGRRVEARGEVPGDAVDDHRLVLPRSAWPASLEALRGARLVARVGPERSWKTWIESGIEGAGEIETDRGELHLQLLPQGGSLRLALRPQPGETVTYTITSDPFRRPEPVAAVAALEDFLAGQPTVGGVRGSAAYLRTAHDLATGEGPVLPARPDEVHRGWINYSALRGTHRLRQTVDPETWDRAVLTVFQRDSTYRDSGRLLAALERWQAEHLEPVGLTLRTAGDVAVSRALIGAVVRTQLQSLALSLLGIGVVVILLAGPLLGASIRVPCPGESLAGLLALVPPFLAVATAFSTMGLLGLPLGVATSMFAGIVLGVGVDGAIHLLARLREARAAGQEVSDALRTALRGVGPAIGLDALAVGGGFGLLAFSSVPANAHLGLLLALAVATCLVANLALLPALWATIQLRSLRISDRPRATIGIDVGDHPEKGESRGRGHAGAVVAGSSAPGIGVGPDPSQR